MAPKNTVKGSTKDPEPQFVTKVEFEGAVSTILEKMRELVNRPVEAVADTKEEREVKAAGPNPIQTNPEWDETAREILGDFLDHTEVAHERSGGIKFTVVIKLAKSNASKEYLEMTKTDRRTKDVGTSGMEGVVEWCKLVRSNLKRTERN